MASIKIVLRKEEKQDGTFPLAIRITKDRKTSYIYLNYSIHPNDWNADEQKVRKSHPNSSRLNNFLNKKLSEATDGALELEAKKEAISVKAVRQKIKPKVAVSFFPQAEDYLVRLKNAGNYNQYTADKSRIGHFKEFLKGEDIAFTDITPGLLEKLSAFLKTYHVGKRSKVSKKSKKPMGERSIINHLVTIRSVFAHARKNKVITKDISPFGGDDGIKIKFPETTKVGITPEEVESLETITLLDARHDHARKIWLFSFYFAGMRASDIFRLRWSDFRGNRLHYSMGKNDKAGSLKIPEKAIAILSHYKGFKENSDDLVFPELKDVDLTDEFIAKRTIAFKTSALDKILRKHVASAAGISTKLTLHTARHTFADLAGEDVPIQMLQKLYRHSHVSTTIGYQKNFITKAADDALDTVINKIKKTSPSLQ